MINFSFFFFFLILIPCATPLSFTIPSITPITSSSSINCTGDAYLSFKGLQLTPDPTDTSNTTSLKNKTGRASYFQPFHLWDNATGKLTGFSTNFSFLIQGTNYGEGIAFVLSPYDASNTPPPPRGSYGGGLGLVVNENSTSTFVAVEFDTYKNPWETGLPVNHVGIDINSTRSVVYKYWMSEIWNGRTNEAWITYDSRTKNLSVTFTDFEKSDVPFKSIYYAVDLRDHLPEWVTIGFSGSTGQSYETNSILSWQFSSSEDTAKEGGNKGLVVGLSVGFGLLLGVGLISFGWYWFWRRSGRSGREKENEAVPVLVESMDDEFKRGTGARKFSYEELALATGNFSEEEKLGAGGFGGVYKGFLRELNCFVAVKKVSSGSKQGVKEYSSEVKIISQLRHRNLVQLIGWCHEKGVLLLVYEFLPNGSLDTHLYFKEGGKSRLLSWGLRYKIAQGIASALFYLHEQWEQCVVHRDIKPSNVMLDANFNAKLGDFGLARFVDHEQAVETTVVAGTMGYLAPECLFTGKASKESDVYSFGIVALEIACGRRPIEPNNAQLNRIKLVEWVWELYGNGVLLEAVDPRLGDDFDERQMECLMAVGLWCAHPDWVLRPSIRQAILVLNFEAPLPALPAQMPVPTSFGPPSSAASFSSLSFYGTGSSSQTQSSNYSGNSHKATTMPVVVAAAASVSSPSVSPWSTK